MDQGLLIREFSRSYTTTHHSWQDFSGRSISSLQRPPADNTRHSQQTNSHVPGGFEPTFSAGERPQTYALNRATTGTGNLTMFCIKFTASDYLQMTLASATQLCLLVRQHLVFACTVFYCVLNLKNTSKSKVVPVRAVKRERITFKNSYSTVKQECLLAHVVLVLLQACCTPFWYRASCQYTPLHRLRPLIFGLTSFGLLRCITVTPNYYVIYYGNKISYLRLFNLRPLFCKHK